MSEQDGGPGRPEERERGEHARAPGEPKEGERGPRRGRLEPQEERERGAGAAEPGAGAAERAPGTRERRQPAVHLPTPARVIAAVVGPILLTVGYFTLPFAPIGGGHRVLRWVILIALLVVLSAGMAVTTARALTDPGGHPGVGILLLAWASILVFAACYWSLAANRDEFVGLSTRLDALYFTGVTMATVGYGDIHPVGQISRAVVLAQFVYTFAFLAGGVAALGSRTRAQIARRVG